MSITSTVQHLHHSFVASAGTIVFGMEDGTVSIFGLIFGVAATTTDSKTVLVAGASGAVAAAVSMMAGAYLDVETTSDEIKAKRALVPSDSLGEGTIAASLAKLLSETGLTPEQSSALTGAVQQDRTALGALVLALQDPPRAPLNPYEQALWMLLADFFAAAVPILLFVFLAVPTARIVSGVVTLGLLVALGLGRARIAKRDEFRTVAETVSIGIAAALAGVLISVVIDHWFHGWAA